MAIVEPELQFFQVGVEMLHADFVERADEGPLEQAPHVLDPVGVDVAAHPLVGAVVDALMSGVVVRDSHIGAERIGVDGFGFILDVFLDELVQGVLPHVGNALEPHLAVPLQGASNPDPFVGWDATAPTLPVDRIPTRAPDHGFVHFDNAKQDRLEVVRPHRLADTVAEVPGGLVRDPERPLDLVGRSALLALKHQVDGREPLPERELRVVEDSPRGDGESVVAGEAMVLVAGRDFGHVADPTPGAAHPVRPAQVFQVVPADFLGVEAVDDVDQAGGLGPVELLVFADVGLVH